MSTNDPLNDSLAQVTLAWEYKLPLVSYLGVLKLLPCFQQLGLKGRRRLLVVRM